MEVTARKFGLHEGEKERCVPGISIQSGSLDPVGPEQRNHASRPIRRHSYDRASVELETIGGTLSHPARIRREGRSSRAA